MPSIHIPPRWRLAERLATPESVFLDRRHLLKGLGLGAIAAAGSSAWALPGRQEEAARSATPSGSNVDLSPAVGDRFRDRFPAERNAAYSLGGRPLTAEEIAGAYNNFYEFTSQKDQVWRLARGYPVDPWKIEVSGLVARPRLLDLEELFTRFPLEERLYRFRCVEAWAMQVPWTGFPLARLIELLEPRPEARWIRFVSLLDKRNLPGQQEYISYIWPYYEALRLDEAMHPLAFVALGSYGHALPMQHGAPWRLAIPWKYGFKGPKSIVRIELTKRRPRTFWNDAQPREYGFFSNVDPTEPHPRWSQASERDIGTGERRPTLPYNGYAEEVGALYDGSEV